MPFDELSSALWAVVGVLLSDVVEGEACSSLRLLFTQKMSAIVISTSKVNGWQLFWMLEVLRLC